MIVVQSSRFKECPEQVSHFVLGLVLKGPLIRTSRLGMLFRHTEALWKLFERHRRDRLNHLSEFA